MSDKLREALERAVAAGREAAQSLERLRAVEQAGSEGASLTDIKAAAAACESLGDFEAAGRFKDQWIARLARGER